MADSNPRVRALLVGIRSPAFSTDTTLRKLSKRLQTMFPSAEVQTAYGQKDTRRTPLLAILETWVGEAREGDTCLFYYTGHGGRAKFTDLQSEELRERDFTYLSCERESGAGFTGILDRELSTHLSELDRRCGNVTAIIDACYSGTVMRDGARLESRIETTIRRFERSPAWVKVVAEETPDPRLAPESHHRVVRLAGASPRSEAHLVGPTQFKIKVPPGMGMFTAALLDVLASVGDDWRRLSWEMLAHAVRERVISAFRMESQWISLAGPGDRLLFSTERAKGLRSVGFRDTGRHFWIRAGSLTGVELGDEWAVAEPLVGQRGRHEPLVRGKVVQLELNRSRLELEYTVPKRPLMPAAALVSRVKQPMPVFAPDSLAPVLDLEATAWLCSGEQDSRNHLHLGHDHVELLDTAGEWVPARFTNDSAGREQLLELLEDRARTQRLLTGLEQLAGQRPPWTPIEWRVGLDEAEVEPGVAARPGTEIWVRLENTEQGGAHWFASVVLIDVIGRSWLLNASQLDGVDLEPQDLEYVGRRPGAVRKGIVLDWPEIASKDQGARVRLVVVSSGRPIQLGHLTRTLPGPGTSAFRMHELDPEREDKQWTPAPEQSRNWGWSTFDLNLQPPFENPG